MSQYQQQAKKRFGQHFLHDRNVIDKMLRAVNLQPTDHVVEIGPGPGALTFPLLELLPRLDVVEIDRDVIAWWQEQPQAQGKLHIHAQDALKLDIPALRGDGDTLAHYRQLALQHFHPADFPLSANIGRISATCCSCCKRKWWIALRPNRIVPTTGGLSVMVQYYCEPHYLLKIGPGAFTPPPKVDSAVVYLKPWATPPHLANDEEQFGKLVQQAFSQRRKTLRNTLKDLLTAEQIESVGIDPTRRAETLAVEDFVNLANLLP